MFADMIIGLLALSTTEGGGTLLDVNPGLIVWTVITFVLLLLILKKVAWKPILAALDQRENAIRESLEKAEKAKDEANLLLKQNETNLLKAEEESQKIIEQSRQYAEKLKAQMLQDSKAQAQKIVEDAAAEIDRRKEAAFDELKTQVADIAINAAEKILKENISSEANKKLVNNYISEITKN
ncbi:MAG: F0F1 ATP synthase subunit B [Ignavibacteriaceae bacterium]|nr:F0F1 ATP synthase subunit B [Ignavibacteriaceae bacterium]